MQGMLFSLLKMSGKKAGACLQGWGWLVLLVGLAVGTDGTVPDGYILQVQTACGSDHVSDAIVTVVTDLPDAMVTASCVDGEFPFTSTDDVNYDLPVSYPGQGSSGCVFQKRQDSLTYVMLVSVGYGEVSGRLQQQEEKYTVTCTFDPHLADDSEQQSLEESLIAPVERQVNNGADTSSSLTLTLVDILGDVLDPSEPLLKGRKVVLKLGTDGSSSESGVRPVSCDAISSLGATYSILRAGCGDGLVFKRHSGFNTVGLASHSPYFDTFGVNDENVMQFQCNVTLCSSQCDGNSCVARRTRRDVSSVEVSDSGQGLTVFSPVFRK